MADDDMEWIECDRCDGNGCDYCDDAGGDYGSPKGQAPDGLRRVLADALAEAETRQITDSGET